MNIELGIRLTDSNYEYENSTKNDTLSSSFESHSVISDKENISKKSFINKLFFFWSTKAMNISNKKILKIKHLAQGQENQINSLFNIIHKEYNTRVNIKKNSNYNSYITHQNSLKKRKKNNSSCPLFLSILKSNMKELLLITFLSVLVIICRYLQIQLLRLLIIIFRKNDELEEDEGKYPLKIKKKIYLYSIFFLINKISLIFLQNHSNYRSQVLGIKAGNMLSALIYDKLLNTSSIYSGDLNEGKMINYLQVDIDHLGFVFFFAPMTFVVPIQFIINFYMLFNFFGYTFFFGLMIFFFYFL